MTLRRSTFAPSASRLLVLAALGFAAGAASAQDAPDRARGEAVYEHWCAPCHAAGPGHPGTQSLQLKYNGSLPAVLVERTDLSAEAIKTFVRQGILSMAPFRKTEITDAELDALAAYLTQK
ncbi:MAG TPA: cytochrome c [Gammaproteobacteria bacterium]